ncbi:hypothetical protein Gdia_1609 [Gluconacetobacter diazotrophicus PA1 5]|uniref:hypothetical protein n=1 Tax=Gluconacetobacter diazotrophicus TaxID=33996 RepID=UPI000173CFD6|nr:hypothetical protein [Gluconacetobacter diazotrophicus]ACI51387.1 hypothetical protein Gdia_1609 [Gluconacetobacter diazotrophicus PA1 5]TWB00144.1 hypothetical protein FBZ86_1397 [Gluconacetobacter diazotrophicus]
MSNPIVPYSFTSPAGDYSIPRIQNDLLNQSTINSIKNAWDSAAIIDSSGRVWINSQYMHTILRTTPQNSRYLIGGIDDSNKHIDGDYLFVRGSSILEILDVNIQCARGLARENYLRVSEAFYRAIRDCDKARITRAEFYEHLMTVKQRLKQQRISMSCIDELDGSPLDIASCEFSHIRSVAIYPHLSGLIGNGLIVNKETHNIITNNGINDEHELLELCQNLGWNTDWYSVYQV